MKEGEGPRISRRVFAVIPCGVIGWDCEPICPTVDRRLLIALVALRLVFRVGDCPVDG